MKKNVGKLLLFTCRQSNEFDMIPATLDSHANFSVMINLFNTLSTCSLKRNYQKNI